MKTRHFSYENCKRNFNSVLPPDEYQLPSLNGKDDALYKVNQQLRRNLPILYRYTSLNEHTIDSLFRAEVYMVPASKMNDVFEGAAYGTDSSEQDNMRAVEELQNAVYLKSFSIAEDDNLMWGHYGDAHKGVCIGYDFSKADEQVKCHLYPVQYSDKRFSTQNVENVAQHPFLYLRKSRDWKYEKEFRLIYKEWELPEGNDLRLGCICEVRFGLRTPAEDMAKVINILGPDMKFYRTKQEENSFKLVSEEICLNRPLRDALR